MHRLDINFETLFESMPTPFMVLDRDLRFVAANTAYLDMTARTASDLMGNHVFDVFPETAERQAAMEAAFALALAGTENTIARSVFAIERPGKGYADLYWDVHHTPVRNPSGAVVAVLQHALDVSTVVEAERMRDVISQEYDHRVRNMMTRISAIARQTARHSYDSETFLTEFDQRILAMARTHELLLHGGWDTLSLRTLVKSALEPHAGGDLTQVAITGDDHTLSSRVGQALGMALHELASNAARYGTFSQDEGKLTIAWQSSPERGLEIDWQESGLSDLPPAGRQGFGTTIIDKVLPKETGGTVTRTLTASGLHCLMVIPDLLRV